MTDRIQSLEDTQLKMSEIHDTYGDLDHALKQVESKVHDEQTSGGADSNNLDNLRVWHQYIYNLYEYSCGEYIVFIN